MNQPSVQTAAWSALSAARRVDAICDEFENAWRNGETPEIDGYLQAAACGERPELLRHLARIEREYRETQGLEMRAGETSAERLSGETPRSLGRFQLLEPLGRGGFGVVYRAYDPQLDRTVAVKTPHPQLLDSADQVDRFLREGRSAAQLRHPGIVAVHEVGEEGGRPFIVSEFIDGATLSEVLAEGRPEFREAAGLVAEIARAIDEAHRQEIIHRDIKPSNVLIDREGRPHVTDFGLSRRGEVERTLTQQGQLLGTPAYMSPEQAAGTARHVDARTDIYSLGVMLYELLSGRLPFEGETHLVIDRVLHEEPIPLRNLDAAIPRDLERIVLRCLEKSPQRRYGSAAELAADLEAFLNGRPVAARRSGFLNLAARALRDTRHATVMQSQGLLLMVMGVVLLVQHVIAHWMLWNGVTDRSLHGLVWLSAYPLWFVMVRRFWRQTGPSNHVERQIVQIWIGGIVMIWGVLGLETWLGLPIMTLAPLIALTGGSLFLVTARLVSGRFYLFSAALYFCAVLMALLPDYAVLILGFAVFCGYFIHGWTFHRAQRRAAQ